MTFEEARAQFPVLERVAYLNAGTNGPLPSAAADALRDRLARDVEAGRSGQAWLDELLALREDVRRALAAVLGTDPAFVAIVDSTSRGCQTVLAGLELDAGDEIVTTDQEHFGLIGPVHASGARVVVVPGAGEDQILAAVTPRTRLIATSHILWTTGRRLELERLREKSGVPILVDGAQSAGAVEISAEPFDFYTVSAQKWLCGPEATGALYIRDPERLRVASPSSLAAVAYEPDGSFTPKDGAARFDSGWIGAPTLAGLAAALAVHPEWRYVRAAEIAARCRELLEPVVEVVTPPGHSTLVSFRPNGDPTSLVDSLWERGVVVRELPGRNLVRASCGWWTSEEDLQRLAEGLVGTA
jgi:L-cysteine/cystine lyase